MKKFLQNLFKSTWTFLIIGIVVFSISLFGVLIFYNTRIENIQHNSYDQIFTLYQKHVAQIDIIRSWENKLNYFTPSSPEYARWLYGYQEQLDNCKTIVSDYNSAIKKLKFKPTDSNIPSELEFKSCLDTKK